MSAGTVKRAREKKQSRYKNCCNFHLFTFKAGAYVGRHGMQPESLGVGVVVGVPGGVAVAHVHFDHAAAT